MGGRWRLFIAVPIGEQLRTRLAEAVEAWRDRPDFAGLRWTEPAALHLTLLFLGATDPAAVPKVVRALEEVASRHVPMRLATGGLGAFPSPGKARVAWYGVDDSVNALRGLAYDVRRTVATDEAARFRAHVTLARARAEPVDLRGWVREAAPAGALSVTEMLLIRSHLGAGPARYEVMRTVSIGSAVHA
jgi:2'-5' RNA ligase